MENKNLSTKGQNELKKWEEQSKLQEQIELSIKEFILKDSGKHASVKTLLYEMISGRSRHWEDQLPVIQKQIRAIIAVFMEPAVLKHFKELCPDNDEHVGETLIGLLELFYRLESPLAYAEIDLGSLEESLRDVESLKQFALPYRPVGFN